MGLSTIRALVSNKAVLAADSLSNSITAELVSCPSSLWELIIKVFFLTCREKDERFFRRRKRNQKQFFQSHLAKYLSLGQRFELAKSEHKFSRDKPQPFDFTLTGEFSSFCEFSGKKFFFSRKFAKKLRNATWELQVVGRIIPEKFGSISLVGLHSLDNGHFRMKLRVLHSVTFLTHVRTRHLKDISHWEQPEFRIMNDEDKEEHFRRLTVEEIIRTERDYASDLGILYKVL